MLAGDADCAAAIVSDRRVASIKFEFEFASEFGSGSGGSA